MPPHTLSPRQPWAPPVVQVVRSLPQNIIPATTVWLPTQGAKRAFKQAWLASGSGLLPRLVTTNGSLPDLAPLGLTPAHYPTEAETAATLTFLYHALSQAEESQPTSPSTRWKQARSILGLLEELALANQPPEALWSTVPEYLAQHWHGAARVLQAVIGNYQNAVRAGTLAHLPAIAAARWQALTHAVTQGHHILVGPSGTRAAETAFLAAAQANPNAHIFALEDETTPNLTATYAVINAPHRAAEALAIASATRYALENDQTPIVLAVGEPALATLVIHHLRAMGIAPKGFLPHPLGQTPLGYFLTALAAFAPTRLPEGRTLAALAHIQGVLVPIHQSACAWLEELVFRGPTPRNRRAAGWLGKLQRLRTEDDAIKTQAEFLLTHWSATPLFTPPTKAQLGEWCDWLHLVLDALWPEWRSDPHAATWQANCTAWHTQTYGLTGADFQAWLTQNLATWCTEDSQKSDPEAPILTGRLAGWSGAKTLIAAGLSEVQWQPTTPHPWLSEGQRNALGLPTNAQARTLAEAELNHLLAGAGASHIILTRAGAEGTTPLAPTPAYQGFITQNAGLVPAWEDAGRAFLPVATATPVPATPTALPWPAPATWSPSLVEAVLACPFKAALTRLGVQQPWEPFDAWPDARHFGNLLHDAAQEFWTQHPSDFIVAENAAEATSALQAIAENLLMRRQPDQAPLWAPRIRKLCEGLVNEWVNAEGQGWENAGSETVLTATLPTPNGPIHLKARADKIDVQASGALRVIDYKTGSPPSETDMLSGKKPQLPMLALMLRQANPNVGEIDAAFWRLVGYNARGVEEKILKDATAHIERVRENLPRVLSEFLIAGPAAQWPATPGLENAGILPAGPCTTCPAAGWCRYPAWASQLAKTQGSAS